MKHFIAVQLTSVFRQECFEEDLCDSAICDHVNKLCFSVLLIVLIPCVRQGHHQLDFDYSEQFERTKNNRLLRS